MLGHTCMAVLMLMPLVDPSDLAAAAAGWEHMAEAQQEEVIWRVHIWRTR
jgi:hypothetical protein